MTQMTSTLILAHLGNHNIPFTRQEINDGIKMLKQRWDRLSQGEVLQFNPGDKVEFDSRRNGQKVTGVVNRINTKSVGVRATDGVNWKVSPSLLRKVA